MDNLKKLIVGNNITLKINNTNIDYIYNNLPKLIKLCSKKYKVNFIFSDILKEKELELRKIEIAINIKNYKERYNYIYDEVCKKLDSSKNYCKFRDGICLKYRDSQINHVNGCCEMPNRGKCKYLTSTGCSISCISCKLFMCKFLEKKGHKNKINDYLLLKYFFNIRQKDIINVTFFTEKEIIINKLLKIPFKI